MTTATRPTQCTAGVPTLMVAFELGQRRWVVGFSAGNGQPPRTREIPARDTGRVRREIAQAKQRWGLPAKAPVVSCYEAGREGFWLHRWLEGEGIGNVVVDSSSIEVPRRARRAKTDELDARALLRLLARWHSGEREVWRVVRVPSVEAEDARQLEREVETVKADRTRIRNRIHGLLAAQGLALRLDRHLPAQLAVTPTGDGRPLPAGLQARLARELTALATIEARLRTLHTARRVVRDPVRVQLQQLRGIGLNGAACLSTELFGWRSFTSGEQVGALAGLTPTPYRSSTLRREQGISKAGNRRVRLMAVELAWCWRQYQHMSALTQWYERRFGHGTERQRRIGIVALARKLLIALWRYVTTGQVPAGAQLKTT